MIMVHAYIYALISIYACMHLISLCIPWESQYHVQFKKKLIIREARNVH